MASIQATTLSIPGYLITLTEEEGYCLYDALYRDNVEDTPKGLQALFNGLEGVLFPPEPQDDTVPF